MKGVRRFLVNMEKIMNKKVGKLRLMIVSCLLLAMIVFVNGQPGLPDGAEVTQIETRCGWFSNPTPANISLYDRDAEWIISVQGGYQVEGDWDWPDFKPGQWVVTNASSYGYGCVCMQLRVNKETERVLEIKSSSARSLSACRRDRSLKRWNDIFK
jgi:hypothetical protein